MRIAEDLARRLLSEARVARLGTIDPDGAPNLVPFCFALVGDTLYSAVDDKPKVSKRLRRTENLLRDPRGTILVDHYDDDWTRVWWVRVRVRGRVVEHGSELEGAVEALRGKYEQYREEPPDGAILAFDVDSWRGWSYSPIE